MKRDTAPVRLHSGTRSVPKNETSFFFSRLLPGFGTASCWTVQVHKKMVVRQLQRIDAVPRPQLGSGWNGTRLPDMAVEYWGKKIGAAFASIMFPGDKRSIASLI